MNKQKKLKNKSQKLDSKYWGIGVLLSVFGIIFVVPTYFFLPIGVLAGFSDTQIEQYQFFCIITGSIFLLSTYIFALHKYVYEKIIVLFLMISIITLLAFFLTFFV